MTNNRMLILPAELVDTVNQNRGDLTQAQFIEFLIDVHLKDESSVPHYATQEELVTLEQDIKGLLRSFLDFAVSYGMALGSKSGASEIEDNLSNRLQDLQTSATSSSAPETGTTSPEESGPDVGEAVEEAKLGEEARESFTSFCGKLAPIGDMRRVVVATEGARRLLGTGSVSEKELRDLFELAGWRQPADFLQTMRNAARKKFRWLERVPGKVGYYIVTSAGRDTVTGVDN